jgi:hypothetical protein
MSGWRSVKPHPFPASQLSRAIGQAAAELHMFFGNDEEKQVVV